MHPRPTMPEFKPGDPPDERLRGWTFTIETEGPMLEVDTRKWRVYAMATVRNPRWVHPMDAVYFMTMERATSQRDKRAGKIAEQRLTDCLIAVGCVHSATDSPKKGPPCLTTPPPSSPPSPRPT